jgi:hypothetical protein
LLYALIVIAFFILIPDFVVKAYQQLLIWSVLLVKILELLQLTNLTFIASRWLARNIDQEKTQWGVAEVIILLFNSLIYFYSM